MVPRSIGRGNANRSNHSDRVLGYNWQWGLQSLTKRQYSKPGGNSSKHEELQGTQFVISLLVDAGGLNRARLETWLTTCCGQLREIRREFRPDRRSYHEMGTLSVVNPDSSEKTGAYH